MSSDWFYKFDTLSLHAGQRPDPTTGARAVPVVNSTSYVFRDTDHAAGLFNLEEAGHIYSRISNPTVAVFEERIAALEGGVGAVATASGQSAFHLAAATILSAGDHVVSSAAIYGGTHNLLNHTLRRFGVETTFVEPTDPGNFRRAARPNTKLFFGETIGNPRIDVLDISAVAEHAHGIGVPLLIDNTFATPFLSRPIDLGADIVMHSATKFIGGHGVTLGGVLVDSGKFDWAASGRFPIMTEPCPGYHGIAFAEHYGPPAFILKARLEGLRDFGACLNPQAAFYLLQGLETLPLRVARHTENAGVVAKFLEGQEAVDWVSYPDLPSHPQHDLARKLLPNGSGALLTFGIRGGLEAGVAFIEGLQLWSHLANVGDAKSLVIHPASTTHQQMTAEELAESGVTQEMVRLSVGLEDPDDLVADLDRALKRSQKRLQRPRAVAS
ncbi:MAG: O-acetylhomoserine aminocarboxypropyltransferase [Acidobacteria bacterium]|nr:O-acetylhomoserine aminocarboxypropyltransferase [Acidobacteriota bacterium]